MITSESRPELTPNCCHAWPRLADPLQWFTFADWPDLLAMPCIGDLRVNYCPACGQPRRDVVRSVRA